jgi:hypothetical protein
VGQHRFILSVFCFGGQSAAFFIFLSGGEVMDRGLQELQEIAQELTAIGVFLTSQGQKANVNEALEIAEKRLKAGRRRLESLKVDKSLRLSLSLMKSVFKEFEKSVTALRQGKQAKSKVHQERAKRLSVQFIAQITRR